MTQDIARDGRALRGVIDDFCQALEEHGVDLSGIGGPYTRIALREKKNLADELIEKLEGHVIEARQEYQGARADAEEFRQMANTAIETVEKLRAEISEMRASLAHA